MTESYTMGMFMSVWFGVLTSISPCPLASNIAAVSYIGRRVDRWGYVLAAGLLYMAGRMITYTVLAMVLVSSMGMIPSVANFLQRYMSIFIGPLLISVGLVLLDIISIPTGSGKLGTGLLERHIEKTGIWGSTLLGVFFALSFCPVSAALFFGSLLPLAVTHSSSVLLPSLYGIGTALPVLALAFLMAFATSLIGQALGRLRQFEIWARKITGAIFIAAGLYSLLNSFSAML